jgi:RNA polymerase-binding transcription factor DksA
MIKFPNKVLKPIQEFLLEKQKKLTNRKKELAKEDPFADTDRLTNNAASDADAVEQWGHDRVAALKLEVDKGLINIRKTLTKIKLGSFGQCEKCNKLIDTDRLAIDPTIDRCISCSEKGK